MKRKKLLTTIALVIVVIIAACKKDTYVETAGVCPLIVTTDPVDHATGVPLNMIITATFNEIMNAASITPASFTIETGAKGAALVTGTITYAGMTATFTPTSPLIANKTYTGTIKSTVKDLKGNYMQADYVWSFTTATVPTVILADPFDTEPNVALNKVVRATFSEVMDPLSILGTTTFTLLNGSTPVGGTVTYAGSIASFTPAPSLLAGTTYTARVTTAAKNVAGIPMASDFVWTFETIPAVTYTLTVTAANGSVAKNPDQSTYNSGTIVTLTATADPTYAFTSWDGDKVGVLSPTTILMNGNKNVTANFIPIAAVCPPIVPLGLSGNYVIFAETAITTTGTTSVIGDMGINPSFAASITGFALTLPAGGAFSSSSLVTGNIYAPDYADPTPAEMVTATTDMTTAYTTANGVAPTVPDELNAGILSGDVLVAGVYKWGTDVTITTNITLDGGADPCATFIFQIAGDLIVANGVNITLQNGAVAKNIFWVVAGSKAALGTTVDFSGNILCKGLISLNTGATVVGRLLSQTQVTLIANTVKFPL